MIGREEPVWAANHDDIVAARDNHLLSLRTENEQLKAQLAAINAHHEDDPGYVSCPFCKESNFDLIGLKIHLTNYHCSEYSDTPIYHSERAEAATLKPE